MTRFAMVGVLIGVKDCGETVAVAQPVIHSCQMEIAEIQKCHAKNPRLIEKFILKNRVKIEIDNVY